MDRRPSVIGRIFKKLFARGIIKQVSLLLGKREVRPWALTVHAHLMAFNSCSGFRAKLPMK